MGNLTAARLREVLNYDPNTGGFTWRVATSSRACVGYRAGCIQKGVGYRLISVDGHLFNASRLAWLYVTNEWPQARVDHINLDKGDNRWCNLRAATTAQNGMNSCRPSSNTSGFKGVSWSTHAGMWRAQIRVDGRLAHLGYFDTPERAFVAYALAAQEHFGAFARIGRGKPFLSNETLSRIAAILDEAA